MNFPILNITLKQYQYFSSVVIFIIWVYIIFQSFRNFNDFKKASGKTYASLLDPFNSYKLKKEIKENSELALAYKLGRSKGRKLFFLWILTILIFMIGAAIVGNSTATVAVTRNKYSGNEQPVIPLNPFENKLKGTWKLSYSSYLPIELPNFNGGYRDMILELRDNRKAQFYFNNIKDSVAEYDWSADSLSISFLRYDVVTSAKILYLKDSSLSFSFFKIVNDTLVFKRL